MYVEFEWSFAKSGKIFRFLHLSSSQIDYFIHKKNSIIINFIILYDFTSLSRFLKRRKNYK